MIFHSIEQTQLRSQHRVDGVGRPKFDSTPIYARSTVARVPAWVTPTQTGIAPAASTAVSTS